MTINQISRPRTILAVVPIKWPRLAPKPKWMESFILRPEEISKIQATMAAPAQEPISVPSKGIGISKVPRKAPERAPSSAPTEPKTRAPAFFAPTNPPKNSTSSPMRAREVIIIRV